MAYCAFEVFSIINFMKLFVFVGQRSVLFGSCTKEDSKEGFSVVMRSERFLYLTLSVFINFHAFVFVCK